MSDEEVIPPVCDPVAANHADGVESSFKRNPLPLAEVSACGLSHCRAREGDCRTWDRENRRLINNCLCQQEWHRRRVEASGMVFIKGGVKPIDWYSLRPTALLYRLGLFGLTVKLGEMGGLEVGGSEDAIESLSWVVGVHTQALLWHLTPRAFEDEPDLFGFDPGELEKMPLAPATTDAEYEFEELAGMLEEGGAARMDAEAEARRILRDKRRAERDKFRQNIRKPRQDAV